jgi:hypothetical protein
MFAGDGRKFLNGSQKVADAALGFLSNGRQAASK